jgi:hypothetical protein
METKLAVLVAEGVRDAEPVAVPADKTLPPRRRGLRAARRRAHQVPCSYRSIAALAGFLTLIQLFDLQET